MVVSLPWAVEQHAVSSSSARCTALRVLLGKASYSTVTRTSAQQLYWIPARTQVFILTLVDPGSEDGIAPNFFFKLRPDVADLQGCLKSI